MADSDPNRLQPVEYDDYPPSPPKKSPSKRGASNTRAPGTFSRATLKKVGDVNKDRLPPASAMKGMLECTSLHLRIPSITAV